MTNKLLPAGTGGEGADRLIESEEYFNKLTFDQIASASVNVFLIQIGVNLGQPPPFWTPAKCTTTLPWETVPMHRFAAPFGKPYQNMHG